ncbi:DUF6481 family protein [Caulobacter sp. 17J80-11]|uniref:DUF6481 family protein n=1 Tax=Caulobacter sp. 17J80-11 TaxID=2763502 RepID=UPI001653E311|nr:DUF6481 family protein [Caulobacter sp. 17J80-11]MBC6982973.1 hypothetical protein [Caulobacter sp. 17J80-11]
MAGFKGTGFNDRLSSQAAAKKAMLEKFKPKPTVTADGTYEERKAAEAAELEAAREARKAEREAKAAEAAAQARAARASSAELLARNFASMRQRAR